MGTNEEVDNRLPSSTICEFLFKHSSTNEEVDSSGSSNVSHLRKRSKRVADTSEKKAESQKKAKTEPVGNVLDPEWTRLSNIFGHSLPNLSVRNKSIFKTKTRSSKSGTNTGNSMGTSKGRITPAVLAYMPQCEKLTNLQKAIGELELNPFEEEKVIKYYQQSDSLGVFLMQDKTQRARNARFIIQNGL